MDIINSFKANIATETLVINLAVKRLDEHTRNMRQYIEANFSLSSFVGKEYIFTKAKWGDDSTAKVSVLNTQALSYYNYLKAYDVVDIDYINSVCIFNTEQKPSQYYLLFVIPDECYDWNDPNMEIGEYLFVPLD